MAKIYGRFILTTLLNLTLARADIPEVQRVPCHFYVDEFHNFISDSFQEVFSEGRKYKVYLTVATQVIGQGMSMEMQKNILGNTNVKVIGKAGYESRNEMMRQMGFSEKESKRKGITKRTFAKLKVGRFISQVDIYNPRKLKVPKFLLGHKHSMNEKKWQVIMDRHRRHKYSSPFY